MKLLLARSISLDSTFKKRKPNKKLVRLILLLLETHLFPYVDCLVKRKQSEQRAATHDSLQKNIFICLASHFVDRDPRKELQFRIRLLLVSKLFQTIFSLWKIHLLGVLIQYLYNASLL